MNKEAKGNKVSELSELLNSSKATFIADYRGMDVEAVNKLRGELRLLGVDYRVAKNTLMRLAAKGTGAECLDPLLQGPTAVAFASEDVAAPAKVLAEFAKTSKFFELKGGIMDGKSLSVDDIKVLADLPSREVLLATVLRSISAPATNFVGVLAAVPRTLVQVLAAIQEQKAA
ncbi:MAG: 50S ribosomal protein L10 [Desulfuromonadaceae bacterium]|nr:50S ribosomal protein L10 [Desulfuromonadaceae bacterium]